MSSILTDTTSFHELRRIYSECFSLGYINGSNRSPIENRFILISLICYVVNKNKPKNPDFTPYTLLYKLNANLGIPDSFIKGLSVVCEDFAYCCNDFPTFGLEGKKILEEIVTILRTYVPF